jgi:hypothetical protein
LLAQPGARRTSQALRRAIATPTRRGLCKPRDLLLQVDLEPMARLPRKVALADHFCAQLLAVIGVCARERKLVGH